MACGRWDRTGASDLNPTARNARKRWGGGVRWPVAATGGERRRARRRNPNLEFPVRLRRGLRLREAREAARRSRVVVAVETRRRGCLARRRGAARVAKSGEVPMTKTSDAGGSLTSLRASGRAP
jgi:hypothetical protein